MILNTDGDYGDWAVKGVKKVKKEWKKNSDRDELVAVGVQ